MFQSFVGSDRYLRGQALTVDKHGAQTTVENRESRRIWAAANHKRSIFPGIASRLVNTIEFSTLHASAVESGT
jgi:hypothetical protein